MTEDNPDVVAAEVRTQPAFKKLARAYIALGRQVRESVETVPPASDAPAEAHPKEATS